MGVRRLAIQAFIFASLSVSWLLRVQWPPSDIAAYYDSPFVEIYRLVGWAAVDHLILRLDRRFFALLFRDVESV